MKKLKISLLLNNKSNNNKNMNKIRNIKNNKYKSLINIIIKMNKNKIKKKNLMLNFRYKIPMMIMKVFNQIQIQKKINILIKFLK